MKIIVRLINYKTSKFGKYFWNKNFMAEMKFSVSGVNKKICYSFYSLSATVKILYY